MSDPYLDREQSKAKHFILRRYLQALAFKVLTFRDITYVDGFSGPWKSRTEDFIDSSFRIAIDALKDAQKIVSARGEPRRRIKCFFSENNRESFNALRDAVTPFHNPDEGFEIKTYFGSFEDAIPEIRTYIGDSFPLVFVDPTGWSGYSFDKIKPLVSLRSCEVLINFMYDFVNRAASMSDAKTIASLNPILGGPNWQIRLDANLPRGRAIEKLFRDTLTSAGGFEYVVSTKIDRSTADRPHFFIVYGTKSHKGLKAFRDTEYDALKLHARDRANAKARKRENKIGSSDFFAAFEAEIQEATIENIVSEQKAAASDYLLKMLDEFGPMKFSKAWSLLLEGHMLRVTNVKDICLDLAKAGKLANTWGGGNRKPHDEDTIILANR